MSERCQQRKSATSLREGGGRSHRKFREAQAIQKVLNIFKAGEYWILTAEHACDEARREAVEHSDLGPGARHVAGRRGSDDREDVYVSLTLEQFSYEKATPIRVSLRQTT
jgi:hypothetical protein